jgi:hypothetical protein
MLSVISVIVIWVMVTDINLGNQLALMMLSGRQNTLSQRYHPPTDTCCGLYQPAQPPPNTELPAGRTWP